jgi:hypothetical protein
MTFSASVNNTQVSLDNDTVSRVVDTCCLGCVFAEGKVQAKGKKLQFSQSQHGCDMGVLHKMRKRGEEIQDAVDNDGNEFHVIRGRMCPFHRTPNWEGWSKAKQQTIPAMVQARQEVQLKPDVVIYLDNDTEPFHVLETIDALNQGQISPARIYLANNSDMKPSQVMKLMSDCPLPWRAETIADGPISRDGALDVITAKCTSIFVTYFSAGYKPPLDFFVPIDQALYDDLDKFVVLEPLLNSINGMTVLRTFYKQAGGNARKSIVDKAKKISKEQQCQYLVRPVTQVVTQLSQ